MYEPLKLLDEMRVEVGSAPLSKKDFRCLQERIAFTRSRCDLTADKTREMLERVKGQINVVRAGIFLKDCCYTGKWLRIARVYLGLELGLAN